MSNIELFEISSELVQSALRETIKTLTKSTIDQIKITTISSINSDNPSCNIYRISFSTNGESKTSTSSSSLILKVTAQNLTRRFLSHARPCFLREIFIYDEVRKVTLVWLVFSNIKIN